MLQAQPWHWDTWRLRCAEGLPLMELAFGTDKPLCGQLKSTRIGTFSALTLPPSTHVRKCHFP